MNSELRVGEGGQRGDSVESPTQADLQHALRWLVGDEDEPVRTGGDDGE